MKRILRTIGVILLVGVFLLGGLFVFLQTPTGQDFLTRQVVSYLRDKLKTRLEIKQVRFQIPDWISLEGVYLEDTQKDTLLAGGKLHIDLDMMALLHSRVAINQIEVENIRVKVKRTLPDTAFNFAFIEKAFAGNNTAETANSSPLDISLKGIKIHDFHLTYLDNVSGSDADILLKNAETAFAKFNVNKSKYHLSKLNLDGGKADLRLYQPLKNASKKPSLPADSLDLQLGKIQFTNLAWNINLEESGIKNKTKLGKLTAESDKIYLDEQRIKLKNAFLENTDAVVEFSKKVQNTSEKIVGKNASKSWIFLAEKLQSSNLNLRFDDANKPVQKSGLDAAHLEAKAINFDLEKFIFRPNEISGNLKKANFREKSGFVLEDFRTDFLYGKKQTSLKNLYLKTPKTLLRESVLLTYKSVEDFTKNLGNVGIEAKMVNAQLSFRDVLNLAPTLANTPPFKGNPDEILKFDGILAGKINNLVVSKVRFDAFANTYLAASGSILGLPDLNKMVFDLKIQEFSSTKNDLLKAVPDSLIPASIELPNTFNFSGTAKGKISDLTLDTQLNSDFGDAAFVGQLTNFTAKTNQTYDGKISLQNFDVGRLTKQPENIGKVTLNATIKGTGIDPNTVNASINGTMQEAFLKGYDYKNLTLTGKIQNKIADFEATLNDENATAKLTSTINLTEKFPAIVAQMQVEKLNLQKLHLYGDDLALKGKIQVNMTSTDPQNPVGKVSLDNAVILQNGQAIPLKNIFVTAENSVVEGEILTIQSPFLKGFLKGKFDYLQLSDIILTEVNKYFVTPDFPFKKATEPYNFLVKATLVNDPAMQAFLPNLQHLDSTKIVLFLDSQRDTTLRLNVFVPFVQYDSSQVNNAHLDAFATGGKLTYQSSFKSANAASFHFEKALFAGGIANNVVDFKATLKDSLEKNHYLISGFLKSVEQNFRLNFAQNLLLNYKNWQADSAGFVQFGKAGVLVKNFILQQKNQKLQANSTIWQPNSPIRIQADSLDMGTFLQGDSTLAEGKIEGNIVLANYATTPTFTGNLLIKNFKFTQIPIGDLTVKSSNETPTKIIAEATLKSAKNDIFLTGNYDSKSKNPMDFNVNIRRLGAETIKAFSFGQLRRASGNLQGNIQLKGSPTNPSVDGELAFDSVAFNSTKLGATYKIDGQKLLFDGQKISLNKFVVSDSAGQHLVMDGNVNFSKIPKVNYDLKVQTKDFMVLNATRKDNEFFYGQGFVDANLNIKGVGTNAAIDGTVKVRQPSKITVVMPNDIAQHEETEGIVKFVNRNGVALVNEDVADSTDRKIVDFASEISLNIEADDKSEMTIVIDELNGDNIKVKGNAQLNAGMTASGQTYILGYYDLTEGTYDLTFQVLKKQFKIQKGSTLVWTGDPMKADVNITAIYSIEAAPYDLVANDNSEYPDEFRKKIPFNVLLKMQGSLANPDVSFDIAVANRSAVSSNILDKLDEAFRQLKGAGADSLQNKNTNAEMNKQVFALLVLNRFLSNQSSDFFSNVNPEAIARQSVSKILSEQLNNLTSNLIKGVKVDLNLTSSTTDLGSSTYNQTDLNVGLSKAFLNDRLTIKVGRNFELEDKTAERNPAEIFDNVLFSYRLTEDGRYLLGAYRKNQYQAILEGFVVETGVSFAVTMDFEDFKEIFQKKK